MRAEVFAPSAHMNLTPARRRVLAVASAAALTLLAGVPAGAQGGREYPEWYTYDVLAVPDAERRLSTAATVVDELEALIVDLGLEVDENARERASLSVRERSLLSAIEAARDHATEMIVEAYLSAGDANDADYLLGSDASEVIWLYELIRQRADATLGAAAEYQRLLDEASEGIVDLVARSERVAAETHDAQVDLFTATLGLERATVEFRIAEAWARVDAAAAVSRRSVLPWSELAQLRHCESTDNYAAVDPTGSFWGAYQFNHSTWRTVGGQGNPADAPPEEQDARAIELYLQRGAAPWPVCGAVLP